MHNFENDYYILCPDYSQHSARNMIKADRATVKRRLHNRELIAESPPALFDLKEQGADDQKISALLFAVPSIVVENNLKVLIDEINIFGGKYFPAVLKDADGRNHENYWLLNIFEDLDCWCRINSQYEQLTSDDTPHVIEYKFDHDKLQVIDEKNRLIFKMGGVDLPQVFIHRKIFQILTEFNVTGFKAIKVVDYQL